MARVDAMLRMLVQQGGDTLELRRGGAPVFLADGRPLRLFFPDLAGGLYDQIIDGLITDDHRSGLGAGKVDFPYEASGVGRFDVTLKGPVGDQVTLVRAAETASTPAPAPRASTPAVDAPAVREEAPPIKPRKPSRDRASTDPIPLTTGPSGPLRAWLTDALERGASDLHLLDDTVPMARVDGRLLPLRGHGQVAVAEALAGLLGDAELALVDAGGSVDRAVVLPDGTRLRLHVYRCDAGLAAAFRVLRREAPELDELGFTVDLGALVDASAGLVLVCGPSGSGKSTTLAALARRALRRQRGLLITLEDPIEYTFGADGHAAFVRQRQVGRDVPSFGAGLRDALREDPDILLVGELRDPETITLALTAAETGHLVLASMHAPSTASAVERIVDAYPAERQRQIRVQLADVLRAFVAQRLVPRAHGSGRVPAVEVLRGTHAVSALIRDGRTAQLASALQTGREEGLIQLERNLRDLVNAGIIDEDDAMAVAHDPRSLSELR